MNIKNIKITYPFWMIYHKQIKIINREVKRIFDDNKNIEIVSEILLIAYKYKVSDEQK